jgi:hypothetical protein
LSFQVSQHLKPVSNRDAICISRCHLGCHHQYRANNLPRGTEYMVQQPQCQRWSKETRFVFRVRAITYLCCCTYVTHP